MKRGAKGSVPFLDLLNMYANLFQPFLLYLLFPLLRDLLTEFEAQLAFTEPWERKSGYGKVANTSAMNLFLH